jgi:hypothetical protein
MDSTVRRKLRIEANQNAAILGHEGRFVDLKKLASHSKGSHQERLYALQGKADFFVLAFIL